MSETFPLYQGVFQRQTAMADATALFEETLVGASVTHTNTHTQRVHTGGSRPEATDGRMFCRHGWGRAWSRIQGVQDRDLADHPATPRTPPPLTTQNDYLAPTVHSAETEKLCPM